jgi:hypothetical protein
MRAADHNRGEVSAGHVPLLDIQFIKCLSLIEHSNKAHVRARKLTAFGKLTARYSLVGKTALLSFSFIFSNTRELYGSSNAAFQDDHLTQGKSKTYILTIPF